MDGYRLTTKSQEALNQAVHAAAEAGHPHVEPAHLLMALLQQSDGTALPLLRAVGANPVALQGDVREHLAALASAGAGSAVAVRRPEELSSLDGIVIPGGESTAIGRLMRLYGLDEAVREFDQPIFGTCAGMIVLDRDHLGLGDFGTRRNAFGRQVQSFEADVDVGDGEEPVRAVFIRAPWLEEPGPDVEVLAEVDGHPVLARQGRFLVAAFHPELTDDTRLHERFLEEVMGVRA